MKEKAIEIDSFNPYESIFPNRKVVDRDSLNLIKTLRKEGYEIVVLPNNEMPVEYLFKKGEPGILADPLVQMVINLSIGIVGGLVTNLIQKSIDKNKNLPNVIVIDNSTNIIINSHNKKISKNKLSEEKKKRKAQVRSFESCLRTKSPYPNLPWPILLEHKPKIIGWGMIKETERGLEMEEGIITDKTVYRKMQQGKYKGCSITGIAKISTCSICNSDYVSCNHITGKIYDGKKCWNRIVEADIVEFSIVKQPVNTQTFFKLLK